MVQTNALGMDKLSYKNAISFFLYSIMHTYGFLVMLFLQFSMFLLIVPIIHMIVINLLYFLGRVEFPLAR